MSNYKDMTLISKNAEITGDLKFSGGLRIEGTVVGNVIGADNKSQLTLGESGKVIGEIRAPNVVVNGAVEGDIYSSDFLQLAIKARVSGNVYYSMMEMEKGAEVNGSLVHQDDKKGATNVTEISTKADN